jgi:hypothetical protein
MKTLGSGIVALTLVFGFRGTQVRAADEVLAQPESQPTAQGEDWYYRAAPERERVPTMSQQKAAHRASQRMARLDALRWYGLNPGRPQAAPLAFTSMSSPAWQMPGGRPYAWYVSSRPIIVYTRPYGMYR